MSLEKLSCAAALLPSWALTALCSEGPSALRPQTFKVSSGEKVPRDMSILARNRKSKASCVSEEVYPYDLSDGDGTVPIRRLQEDIGLIQYPMSTSGTGLM